MARFILSITLGSDNMTTGADVAESLMLIASKLNRDVKLHEEDRGVIRDRAGDTVGLFQVDADEILARAIAAEAGE